MFDDPGAAPHEPADPTPPAPCWRCGKSAPATVAVCPYCRAPLSSAVVCLAPDASLALAPHKESAALLRMIGVYSAMLLLSLVVGLAHRPELFAADVPRQPTPDELLTPIIVLEVADTLLVLFALVWIAFPRQPCVSWSRWAVAWLLFWPVLAVMLALNLGYHAVVTDVLNLPMLESEIRAYPDLFWWWVVLICVQPAVVEEVFFRGFVLGVLRAHLGVHASVMITALMFALAHIAVPLSMPVLFVLGLGMGYARVASGGLLLPIAMHFAHNAVVLAVEWNQWRMI